MPRFAPGDRVMAGQRSTVFVVRSYDPETGLYLVDGNLSIDPLRPWPAVRAFYEGELWSAQIVEQMERE